jgi:hypothetical protein
MEVKRGRGMHSKQSMLLITTSTKIRALQISRKLGGSPASACLPRGKKKKQIDINHTLEGIRHSRKPAVQVDGEQRKGSGRGRRS